MEPLPPPPPEAPAPTPRCPNCDHPAPQAFCPNCGQDQTDKITSVRHLLADLFSNILTIDARFLRTTAKLLFRPGSLTRAYVAGRRARFTPPARLYVVVSLLFFFSLSLSSGFLQDVLHDDPEAAGEAVTAADSLAQGGALEDIWTGFQEGYSDGDTLQAFADSSGRRVEVAPEGLRVQEGDTQVEARDGRWRIQTGGEEVVIGPGEGEADWAEVRAKVIEHTPKMMFALLPIFALMLKMLYIRRSRFYIEHLIFALHVHAFSFLVMMVGVWLDFFLQRDTFYDITFFIILFYLYLSLRHVYQQGWIKTLVKGTFLLAWYSFTLGIAMIVVIAIAAGSVGWLS